MVQPLPNHLRAGPYCNVTYQLLASHPRCQSNASISLPGENLISNLSMLDHTRFELGTFLDVRKEGFRLL